MYCVCMFQVNVLYFAKSADLTGLREELVSVTTPLSSRDLWQILLDRHPRSDLDPLTFSLSVLLGAVVLTLTF